jgi:hypothetical protein
MGNGNRLRTSASRRANGLGWHLLIYRMPAEPASKRVSVCCDLHRLGALYLQQCVCILPTMEGPNAELNRITSKIPALGGDFTLIDLPLVPPEDEARFASSFRTQRASEYAELVVACETSFSKRVEFESLQRTFSSGAVAELHRQLHDLERRFEWISQHDWFDADKRADAERSLVHGARLLAEFEERTAG